MANIIRWDPFAEIEDLRRSMDRMFDFRPFHLAAEPNGDAGFFPVDLYDARDELVVKASLPGVWPDDIDISITGDQLTLKAESKEEHEEKAENWYRRERRTGAWVRQLALPTKVDADKANASFEHGVLRLALPKAEAVKPKTIKVQTAPVIEAPGS